MQKVEEVIIYLRAEPEDNIKKRNPEFFKILEEKRGFEYIAVEYMPQDQKFEFYYPNVSLYRIVWYSTDAVLAKLSCNISLKCALIEQGWTQFYDGDLNAVVY